MFLHSQNIAAAWDDSGRTHDFDPVFEPVRPRISAADIACCWLGGEFSNSPPYRGYPLFRSPAGLLHALKRAGFDVCLVTNHIMDGGRAGLAERIRLLDSLGLLHPGEHSSAESSRQVLVLEPNGIRVALLGYTYGTNSLPVPEPWMVSLIDTAKMAADIGQAREQGSDFVIVMLHQGEEYEPGPSPEQESTARFLGRQGVDLVVSSHAHVVQPAGLVEAARRMPVLTWCLGNFYCGQTFPGTRTGIIVEVELVKDSSGTRISRAGFVPTYIYRREQEGRIRYCVLPIEQALDDFRAGCDTLLAAEDTAVLAREQRRVVDRLQDRSIPFLAISDRQRHEQCW